MAEIHYVYELKRITPGPGPSRYIGVRTAANSEPENDDYWSSSEKIAKEIGRGVKFQKKVIRKFSSREDAELFEAELHWQHMVGKNPHFYNVTSQLIEGALEQLLPRERYRSPDGEHLWFKAGSEPDGWVRDPARWAQFKDLSHKDGLRQQAGFPQTYEGLELPEWEFHKYYPDEMAFSSSQPRHCHEPYIKLDYRNDVKDCAYFPKGCQPAGWVSGFAPSFRVSGEPPAGWHLLFHISPASQHVNSAYLPRGASLSGWVDVEMYEQMSRDGRISRNSVHDVNNELRYLCDIANDDEDLRNRLRSYRNEKIDSITDYKFYEKIDLLEIDEKSLFHVKDIIGDSRIKVLLHRAFDASRCDDDETEEIIKRQKLFGFFLDNGSELTVEEWAQTLSKLDVSEADKQLALEMVMMQLGVTSIRSHKWAKGAVPDERRSALGHCRQHHLFCRQCRHQHFPGRSHVRRRRDRHIWHAIGHAHLLRGGRCDRGVSTCTSTSIRQRAKTYFRSMTISRSVTACFGTVRPISGRKAVGGSGHRRFLRHLKPTA